MVTIEMLPHGNVYLYLGLGIGDHTRELSRARDQDQTAWQIPHGGPCPRKMDALF